MVLINKAYIVPSIFLGQSRHAITSKGIVLISPNVYIIMLSHNANNLSGIPNLTFCLVTNNIYELPVMAQIHTDTLNNFLNGTFLRKLL
jgi:hypothetical protein